MTAVPGYVFDYFRVEKKKDIFTAAGLVVDWLQFTMSPWLSGEAKEVGARTSGYIASAKNAFVWTGLIDDVWDLSSNSYNLIASDADPVLNRVHKAFTSTMFFSSSCFDAVEQLDVGLKLVDLGRGVSYLQAGSALTAIFADVADGIASTINLIDGSEDRVRSSLEVTKSVTSIACSIVALVAIAALIESALLLTFITLVTTTVFLAAKISLYVYNQTFPAPINP